MNITDANFSLVTRVLKRYNELDSKVEIYLTHHKYVKGQGNGSCFKLIDYNQIEILEGLGIFQIKEIKPNGNNPDIKLYKGLFSMPHAKEWYKNENVKRKPQPTWGWHDKNKGEYQFGKVLFKQAGKKVRAKIFGSLMDLHESTSNAISVKSIHEMTGFSHDRIRIEINAINKRLKKQINYVFEGSGKGYYTLKRYS